MSSFPKICKALAGHDKALLIALIAEMHALSPQNRDFLDARFLTDGAALERYKRTIKLALFPDIDDPVSFRDARKAISDYRKAIGQDAGVAEPLVYAAECGNQFTCDYGDIDGPFYDALIRMFASAVKAVKKLDRREAGPFVGRLAAVVKKSDCIGWGYHDCIADEFADAFPELDGVA